MDDLQGMCSKSSAVRQAGEKQEELSFVVMQTGP